jgi:hypothetical protein
VTGVTIGLTSNTILVAAMFFLFMFTAVVWNVITVSLRQSVIPDHLLGRVNSVYRLFGWGSMPLGAALGGALVTLAEPGLGRETALRLPFFASGAVHLAAFVYALGKLSTATIRAAESEAEPDAALE